MPKIVRRRKTLKGRGVHDKKLINELRNQEGLKNLDYKNLLGEYLYLKQFTPKYKKMKELYEQTKYKPVRIRETPVNKVEELLREMKEDNKKYRADRRYRKLGDRIAEYNDGARLKSDAIDQIPKLLDLVGNKNIENKAEAFKKILNLASKKKGIEKLNRALETKINKNNLEVIDRLDTNAKNVKNNAVTKIQKHFRALLAKKADNNLFADK